MIQSSVVATLGQAVGDAEAALFVGRRREMARFAEWVGRLRTQPGALYVHGPAGTGKSALLRAMAHWADHHEVPSLLLDLEGLTGATGSDLVLALGRHLLGRDAAAVDRGGEAVAAALQRLGGASRCFLLLVDGYDTLGAEEQPFREQVLGRLGPGVGVVLAGRVSVTRLWADAPAWRATVPEVTLPPLEPAEAQHLLDRLAVTDPRLRVPVLDLADGHPRLLVRSAAALRADAAWAAPTAAADAPRFRLFLLERMLHPRSLRKAWRAGGSDEVIAAASLLPRFDRLTLTAALGRSAVDRAWPTLLELAGVSEEGGRYALPPGLRLHLAGAVVAQRPWAEARWRRLMLAHLSARCQAPLPGADPGEDWIAVAALAREARWHAPLHPPAEARDGWRVGCAITVSGIGAPGPSAWRIATVDAAGRLSGEAHGIALGADAELETRVPAIADYVGSLAEVTRQRWVGSTLLVSVHLVPGMDRAVEGVLLREAGRFFPPYRQIVILTDAAAAEAPEGHPLTGLGFRFDHQWIRPNQAAWVLQVGAEGRAEWLRRIALTPLVAGLPEDQWAAAAKEALLAVNEPGRLVHTAAARRYVALCGQAEPAVLRAWVLDAFHSSGLRGQQAGVVSHYYLDRSGSHEEIAAQLDLPRATYYRLHKLALDQIGAALFG